MRAHPQERETDYSAQISRANAVLNMLHNQGRYACGRKYGCELPTRVQHYHNCDSLQGSTRHALLTLYELLPGVAKVNLDVYSVHLVRPLYQPDVISAMDDTSPIDPCHKHAFRISPFDMKKRICKGGYTVGVPVETDARLARSSR